MAELGAAATNHEDVGWRGGSGCRVNRGRGPRDGRNGQIWLVDEREGKRG